jgi:hypothetical protein
MIVMIVIIIIIIIIIIINSLEHYILGIQFLSLYGFLGLLNVSTAQSFEIRRKAISSSDPFSSFNLI